MNSQHNAASWVNWLLIIVAGAWTIFHIVVNVNTVNNNDFWGYALLILFVIALIAAFVNFAQERSSLEANAPKERFPEPAITRFFLGSDGASALWFIVRMNVGASWLLAGWEKLQSPAWGTSGKALAGFVGGALAKTSGTNPSVQGWYAYFLQHFVLPNAGFFSFLVTWGEVAVGLGILLGLLTGIAAGFGVLMNLNYLLAGTVSINPILGVFGLFLCFSWRVCGWVGIDRWLLPVLGLPWKPGTWFHMQEKETPAHA